MGLNKLLIDRNISCREDCIILACSSVASFPLIMSSSEMSH